MIIPYHSQQDKVKTIVNDFFVDEQETFSYINSHSNSIRIISFNDRRRKKSNIKRYIDLKLFPTGLVKEINIISETEKTNYMFFESGYLFEERYYTILNSYDCNGRLSDFLYLRRYDCSKQIIYQAHIDPNTMMIHNPFGLAVFDTQNINNNGINQYFWQGKFLGNNLNIPPGGMTAEFIQNMDIIK